jgi:hypothetical protein
LLLFDNDKGKARIAMIADNKIVVLHQPTFAELNFCPKHFSDSSSHGEKLLN